MTMFNIIPEVGAEERSRTQALRWYPMYLHQTRKYERPVVSRGGFVDLYLLRQHERQVIILDAAGMDRNTMG